MSAKGMYCTLLSLPAPSFASGSSEIAVGFFFVVVVFCFFFVLFFFFVSFGPEFAPAAHTHSYF